MCDAVTCACKFKEGYFGDRFGCGGVNKGGKSGIMLKVEVWEIGKENGTVERWVNGLSHE
jgi:hypothetical protein